MMMGAGKPIRMRVRCIFLAVILAVSITTSALADEVVPPGPTTAFQSKRVAVTNPPAQFDETLSVILNFAPGAFTPVHTHGGLALIAVLEGEMTRRHGDAEQTFRTGDIWIEQPGEAHSAGNKTDKNARIAVTFLLPKGATPTTVVGGAPSPTGNQVVPPGPTTVYQSARVPVANPPGRFDETLFVLLNFAPGAFTPMHFHGGLTLINVTEGEMTRRHGGVEHSYRAGNIWIEQPNEVHAAGNKTQQQGQILVTFLLPKGATPTTVVSAPAVLPRTGGPGDGLLIVAAVGTLALSIGYVVTRRRYSANGQA